MGVIIAVVLGNKNDYVRFHVGQGLALFIFCAGVAIVSGVLAITIILLPIAFLVFMLGMLVGFALWVLGIVNALSGHKEPLPLIGELGEKILD